MFATGIAGVSETQHDHIQVYYKLEGMPTLLMLKYYYHNMTTQDKFDTDLPNSIQIKGYFSIAYVTIELATDHHHYAVASARQILELNRDKPRILPWPDLIPINWTLEYVFVTNSARVAVAVKSDSSLRFYDCIVVPQSSIEQCYLIHTETDFDGKVLYARS